MSASLKRATVYAVKKETTAGELIAPAAATDFIPGRPGESMTAELANLSTDTFINSIGATKPITGKESVSGSFPLYFKGKGADGYPEYSVFLESQFGALSQRTAADTVAAGSTATVINVADGTNYEVGQALLINGKIRNVKSIATNALTLNFALPAAPTTGDAIGKYYGFKPANSGHPTYSLWNYVASGTEIAAAAGNRTTSTNITMNANGLAEITFNYAGVKNFINPITITSTNKYIDFENTSAATKVATIEEKVYQSPSELADEIANKMTIAGGETYTCVFESIGTNAGKFKIGTVGTFKILWLTGTNTDNSAKTTLGYANTDDTGAAYYYSDSTITYPVPFTPSYDAADPFVLKNNELFIGDATENICRKASALSVTIETPVTDVESICATSGVLEKLILSRTSKLTASLLLEKHEIGLFDKLINNKTTQAMINIGPTSAGAYVATKGINIYLGNASITSRNRSGDDVILVDIEMSGFTTDTLEDIYLGFV